MEVKIIDIKTFEDNNNLELHLENGVTIMYSTQDVLIKELILQEVKDENMYYDYDESVIAIKRA